MIGQTTRSAPETALHWDKYAKQCTLRKLRSGKSVTFGLQGHVLPEKPLLRINHQSWRVGVLLAPL
jgi:hypothetical protein